MIETIPITSREQWREVRARDITASVVAALHGVHPYTTELREYVRHRGVEFAEIDDRVLRRGRWLEPAVARAVGEMRSDWRIEQPNVYLRDPDLRLGATPDFYIHGDARGLGVLQTKTAAPSIFMRDWDEGREPPLWITLQSVVEMMLADAAFGAVAVLVVDPFAMDCFVCEVPRNAAAESKITAAVKRFWQQVADGIEPQPDFARDAEVIRMMTRSLTPGKEIDLGGSNRLPEMLERRADLKRIIDAAESECGAIEAEIKFTMADAEIATGLPPGWRVTFKNQERAGYTVPPKTSRVLRITDKREKLGVAS